MDERRTAEGVEHLQAAARELIGAARAFLDVLEDVVEDHERVAGVAGGVAEMVRNGLGLRQTQPWENAAWDVDGAESDTGADWWDESADSSEDQDGGGPEDEAQSPEETPTIDGNEEPRTPSRGSGRVRRIAVD